MIFCYHRKAFFVPHSHLDRNPMCMVIPNIHVNQQGILVRKALIELKLINACCLMFDKFSTSIVHVESLVHIYPDEGRHA